MIEELYQRWLNHPHIDPQLKKELAGMSEKEKQALSSAFSEAFLVFS